MNIVVIDGNLTAKPETRYTQSGSAVTTFVLANNEKYKSGDEWKEVATFLKIVIWGKYGEILSENLEKGSPVVVTGELRQEKWEDKDGKTREKTTINARQVKMITYAKKKEVAEEVDLDDEEGF